MLYSKLFVYKKNLVEKNKKRNKSTETLVVTTQARWVPSLVPRLCTFSFLSFHSFSLCVLFLSLDLFALIVVNLNPHSHTLSHTHSPTSFVHFSSLFFLLHRKVKLKMACQRINMYTTKTNHAIKTQNQQIGKLLSERKDENARIRIEGVLRLKNMLVAVEIISLMSELLGQRLQLIITQNACSPDLIEAVATIIYCSSRIAEIPELQEITQQFALKYTKEWCLTHMNNESNCVSPRIIKLLGLRPPDFGTVMKALKECADEHGVGLPQQ